MKDINRTSRAFCYCGQPGDEKMNMLYCVKCKRWLHEECVKCLDVPLLLGDRFYILICSVCNAGSEFLARIEMTWCDIIHLVLYNLTVIHKKKYFDLDKSILPFIVDNWGKLHVLGPAASVKSDERRNKILEALLKNSKRFKSGREIKKSKNIFGLRQRVPPEAPSVQPSAAKVQNDVVVWEFSVKERAYQILRSKKSKSMKETAKNGKSKANPTTRAKLHPSTQSRSKDIKDIVSKCRGGHPYNENGIHKAKHRVKRTNISSFREESARWGLLDSLIPVPPDFASGNNPFLQSCKGSSTNRTNSLSRKRRHNGENVSSKAVQNDNHKLSKLPHSRSLLQKNNSEMFSDAKDYLSQNSKGDDVCILGKRVTTNGKVQYLLQRNREKVENAVQAKDPPFMITICCHCPKCKIINKLYF
ncbi:Metal-response element-binding transcription factor 2 [Araneus ventricosus]|uniref:Metal-response element-binding transcription factor 2 n=1 Tax=Araneus ventricosus TaxID=182803 RepID=A0A4Y2E079_ARAVE|nr:Metal-response element-binding transcription factor 2 [Araneus ventricosus]